VRRVVEAYGLVMGESPEACRPVRLLDRVIDAAVLVLRAPRREQLERLAADLAAATDSDTIARLQAEVQQIAVDLRQARAGLKPWRDGVKIVEDEARQTIAALTEWLDDCERARGGNG